MRLYTAAALLPAASADVIPNGGVLVDGARIVASGPSGPLRAHRDARHGAEVIDLGDVTLLPGLIDAHVHLGFDGGPGPVARMRAEPEAEQLILMLRSARELLRAGVTTARDLGARAFLDVAVRDAIARGTADGPRLVTAARPITPAGGHCWFMGGECDSPDELRRMVRLHHRMGADLIKVMATGGFMTEGPAPWHAQFTAGELRIVGEEAHRLGRRVFEIPTLPPSVPGMRLYEILRSALRAAGGGFKVHRGPRIVFKMPHLRKEHVQFPLRRRFAGVSAATAADALGEDAVAG